jgi:hypothetical protein
MQSAAAVQLLAHNAHDRNVYAWLRERFQDQAQALRSRQASVASSVLNLPERNETQLVEQLFQRVQAHPHATLLVDKIFKKAQNLLPATPVPRQSEEEAKAAERRLVLHPAERGTAKRRIENRRLHRLKRRGAQIEVQQSGMNTRRHSDSRSHVPPKKPSPRIPGSG